MLLVCLIAGAKAQCPPEQDCEVPPDDDGGGNSYFYNNCYPVITSQGWNPDGSTWMRVCDKCTQCYYDGDLIVIGPEVLRNCSYINKWGSAIIDPSKDIEALAFTNLIAVMEDLTRRTQITTRI